MKAWTWAVPVVIAAVLRLSALGPVPAGHASGEVHWATATAGVAAVVPAMWLGHALFGTRAAAMSAGLLVAVSPWHLAVTRGSHDAAWVVLGTFIMVAGIVSLVRATAPGTGTTGVPLALAVAATAGGGALCAWGDPNGAIAAVAIGALTPLALGAATGAYRRSATAAIIVVTVALIAMAPDAWLGTGVPGDLIPDVAAEVNGVSARRLAADDGGVVGALQAPWAITARTRIAAQASHYDPTFLFTRGPGDGPMRPAGHGTLGLAELPLVVGGGVAALTAIWTWRRANPHLAGWCVALAILAAGPIPASITGSSADATRAIAMLPGIVLLEAGAVSAIWPRVVRRRLTVEAAMAVAVAVGAWAHGYVVHQSVTSR